MCRGSLGTARAIIWVSVVAVAGPSGTFGRLGLEHFQHAIGDHEAADDVEGGQQDGEEGQSDLRGAMGTPHDQNGPHQHDPVDGVAARHQRGVQDAWHPADDLVADERGQYEDGHEFENSGGHDQSSFDSDFMSPPAAAGEESSAASAGPSPLGFGGPRPSASAVGPCTRVPFLTTQVPATISSSKSGASAPSL